jgi:hypothetical protein
VNELVYQAGMGTGCPCHPIGQSTQPRHVNAGDRYPAHCSPDQRRKQAIAESNAEARQRIQRTAGYEDRTGRHPIGERNQWQHGHHVAGGHHTGEPASLGVA